MAEFTPITTQEEFDAAISTRLEREHKKYEGYLSPDDVQKKYADYLSPDDVAKKYEGYLSPAQAAEKDKQIADYVTSTAKLRVAIETGLPAELADRLQGSDEESIRADAAKLANYAKPQTAPPYEPELVAEVDPKKAALSKMLAQMKTN